MKIFGVEATGAWMHTIGKDHLGWRIWLFLNFLCACGLGVFYPIILAAPASMGLQEIYTAQLSLKSGPTDASLRFGYFGLCAEKADSKIGRLCLPPTQEDIVSRLSEAALGLAPGTLGDVTAPDELGAGGNTGSVESLIKLGFDIQRQFYGSPLYVAAVLWFAAIFIVFFVELYHWLTTSKNEEKNSKRFILTKGYLFWLLMLMLWGSAGLAIISGWVTTFGIATLRHFSKLDGGNLVIKPGRNFAGMQWVAIAGTVCSAFGLTLLLIERTKEKRAPWTPPKTKEQLDAAEAKKKEDMRKSPAYKLGQDELKAEMKRVKDLGLQ